MGGWWVYFLPFSPKIIWKLGIFLKLFQKWDTPPPCSLWIFFNGNLDCLMTFSQVSQLFNFEGSPSLSFFTLEQIYATDLGVYLRTDYVSCKYKYNTSQLPAMDHHGPENIWLKMNQEMKRLLRLLGFGGDEEILAKKYFGLGVRHPWWRTMRSWPLFSSTFFFLYSFFTKKSWFSFFKNFLRPSLGNGRLGHPQSLEYL